MIVAMSDDDQDEIAIVKRTRTLHYGSLQEQEMAREASGRSAIDIGIAAGNINITKGMNKSTTDQIRL
jgi:hypothetical protein